MIVNPLLLKLLFIFLFLYSPLQVLAQGVHPGPRATCPICNAQFLINALSVPEAALSLSSFANLPIQERVAIINKFNPEVDANDVIKLMDNRSNLDLKRIQYDRDKSYQTFIVELGDGASDNFFTIKSTYNDWKISSNSLSELLDKVTKGTQNRESVYLLVDDMASEKSNKFLKNVELYNNKTNSDKIKAVGSDFYLKDGETPKRWGKLMFEKGAKHESTSRIVPSELGGIQGYKADVTFSVKGEKVVVSIFGRTVEAVKRFLSFLKSFFITSPDSSIAKAVNRSRTLSNDDIKVSYTEAGMTQFVKVPNHSKDRLESNSELLAIIKYNSPNILNLMFSVKVNDQVMYSTAF